VKRDALALAFTMALPSLMTGLEFLVLPGGHEEGSPAILALFGAGKLVQFLFPLAYVWWFDRDSLRIRPPTARGLEIGIAFGLVVAGGIIGLYFAWLRYTPWMESTPRRVQEWLTKITITTPMKFLIIALFISVLHSFLEEYYWRWFVFGRLARHVPEVVAFVVSGLAFMAHHVIILGVYLPGYFWTLAVPFSLCVAGGGIVWAWLYARTGSLYAPWVSHLLVDAALMVVGYEMVARFWAPA
jgi:membrane protease YdiL (CAAX protease family)